MKKLILRCALLMFPLLSTHSQVVTGGGADYPAEDSLQLLSYKISRLEKHMIARDAECSNGERLLKEGDLMQTYLKLSLFKKPKASQDECDEINRYFACLNDNKTKALMEYVGNPKSRVLLMVRYKISEDEAKALTKFYSELGEKVK